MKIKKKKNWGGGGEGGLGRVGGVRVDVDEENEVFVKIKKKSRIDVYETLCPQQMLVHKGGKIKNWGGECRDVTPTKSLSQNIRVDVNREVKFL